MGEGERRRALLADACYLAGGAALVASAFVHWIARGAGSGLRGHALVDAIIALGKHVPALSPGRLTVVWYLVPALGAASWVVYGVFGARGRGARSVAAGAFVVVVLADAAFWHLMGTARLGWGPKVALLGGVMLCVGAWVPEGRIEMRRDRALAANAGVTESARTASRSALVASRPKDHRP
jgi:hypothetical protein